VGAESFPHVLVSGVFLVDEVVGGCYVVVAVCL